LEPASGTKRSLVETEIIPLIAVCFGRQGVTDVDNLHNMLHTGVKAASRQIHIENPAPEKMNTILLERFKNK